MTKPVKPVEPAPPQPAAKVTTPTQSSATTTAAGKVKGQKSQQLAYEPPTAEYLRAPDGPVVLPVSRYQKVLKIYLNIYMYMYVHIVYMYMYMYNAGSSCFV